MPQIITKYMFSKLLSSPTLRDSMQRLHAISGMDALLLDDLGSIRLTVPRHPSVAFIQLLRANPETAMRFRQMRQSVLAGKALRELGMHEIVYTIQAENDIAGYVLLSGFRQADHDNVDLVSTREVWRRLARAGVPVSWSDWFRAWSALPAYTKEQQRAWTETLALFMRQVLQRVEKAEPIDNVAAWPAFVQKACRRIRESYDTPLRLHAIAAELGVCPEHLSRSFHQATGVRFAEYLAETRIGAACEALATTTTAISEIAYQTGFTTLSRFNRCFRKHREITPRAWRKRALLRGNEI